MSEAQEAPFGVKIRWGTKQTRDENPDGAVEYRFPTEPELDAFLYGVAECDGWLEYEIEAYLGDAKIIDIDEEED